MIAIIGLLTNKYGYLVFTKYILTYLVSIRDLQYMQTHRTNT